MIVENGSHDARPWLRKHEISFSFSDHFHTIFIQQRWFHTKEWESLQKITSNSYQKMIVSYILTQNATFDIDIDIEIEI